MFHLTRVIAAGALALGLAGAAQAATLSFTGPPAQAGKILSPGFAGGGYLGSTGGLAAGDAVDVYAGTGGLQVNGVARLVITLLGFEAGADNMVFDLMAGGESLLKSVANIGNSITTGAVVNTLAPFGFSTTGSQSGVITNGSGSTNAKLKIAFSAISDDGKSVLALFDDGRSGKFEPDFDDMVVRIDVAAVPLPAAGLLLIGALGGLTALSRRRRQT